MRARSLRIGVGLALGWKRRPTGASWAYQENLPYSRSLVCCRILVQRRTRPASQILGMGVTWNSVDASAFLSGSMSGADPGCAYRTHIAALGAVQAVFRIPLHQFQRRHRLVMAGVVTRTVVGKASVGRHRLFIYPSAMRAFKGGASADGARMRGDGVDGFHTKLLISH